MNSIKLFSKVGVAAATALLASVSAALAGGVAVGVPEPSAWALVAVGVVGVIVASRWRK